MSKHLHVIEFWVRLLNFYTIKKKNLHQSKLENLLEENLTSTKKLDVFATAKTAWNN